MMIRISKKTLLIRNAINMRCLDDYFSRKRLELYTDSQIKIRYHWFKHLKVSYLFININ